MILGLTGRMGAGKDTVYGRLEVLLAPTPVHRKGFADPLKDSVCALFGITREELERWKNDITAGVTLEANCGPEVGLNMRNFLQRYGTEAHRDIFGEDFWLNATLPLDHYRADELIVITDCRFPNEAQRVRMLGGLVMEVVGPGGKMQPDAEHASERAFEPGLLDGLIFNVVRDDHWLDLDNSLRNFVIPKLLGRR